MVQNVEFSLDRSEARYIGYERRTLRIRFYMIVHLEKWLFHSWSERIQHTLQWWCNYWGFECANLHPCQHNLKNRALSLYFGIAYFFSFHLVVVFLPFSEVFGLFSGDFGFQYRNVHPAALSIFIFLSLGKWAPLRWPMSLLQLRFPQWRAVRFMA